MTNESDATPEIPEAWRRFLDGAFPAASVLHARKYRTPTVEVVFDPMISLSESRWVAARLERLSAMWKCVGYSWRNSKKGLQVTGLHFVCIGELRDALETRHDL